MEICSSSCCTSCFDLAADYLDAMSSSLFFVSIGFDIVKLEEVIRLLQTLDLYLRKCRRRRSSSLERDDEGEMDVISFKIHYLIERRMQNIRSAVSAYAENRNHANWTEIKGEVNIFLKEIKLFYETEVEESCTGNRKKKESFIDFLLDNYWLGDPRVVIDFIDSLLKNRERDLRPSNLKLQGKLKFLKSFIIFAMLHGVGNQQLLDLLIHTEVMAMNAFRLIADNSINIHGFQSREEVDVSQSSEDQVDLSQEVEFQNSQLVKIGDILIRDEIYPSDPQARETYISVLSVLTASKLSTSSPDVFALEENKHVLADFIDGLIDNIMEPLESCTTVMNPMLKLLEGLRFLTVLLRGDQEKYFNKLHHEMKNLIGVVVLDAAIIIFSISMDQSSKEDSGWETDLALVHFRKVVRFIMGEVSLVYLLTSVWRLGFPRTNELGSLDFLLRNLEELASCNQNIGSSAFPVGQIQTLQKDLEFLRSFLEVIKEQRNHNEKLQSFWSRVMDVAYEVELVIDTTLAGDGGEYCLDIITRNIDHMKIEAQEISGAISHDVVETRRATKIFTRMPSAIPTTMYNEDLVGLDNELETITKRLTHGSERLDVVQIVGMPGLGKTTLANRVYNSPFIRSCFHIRAWCTVSQVYSKQNLFVQILRSIFSWNHEEYMKMDEFDLAEKLKQALLRNKYLLVLDDLWDVEAYNLLKRSFPDDTNGSRILITSRLRNLSQQLKHDGEPYSLRQLTDEESWELLQKKLFGKEGCPAKLSGVGSRIAKSCKGLPLTIVLVSGILANTTENFWEEVEKNLSSGLVLEEEYCMKTLELSYRHLPDDMKSCFLYFAAFQEDESILVRRLLWLWICEGFVQKTADGKTLEDLAEEYLKALVDRSLVVVSQQRTLGGAKACRLHDLVHEFSIKKAKEENFLHHIHSLNCPSALTGPINPHRVCESNAMNSKILENSEISELQPMRTLLLFKEHELQFWFPRLLRVLDLRKVTFDAGFPIELVLLVLLRYLALNFDGIRFIPSAIANLSRLRTFLAEGESYYSSYLLPKTIWNMKTLRHLCTKHIGQGFVFPVEYIEESSCLDHLDTLSLAINGPSVESLKKVLAKFPSIRRLNCRNNSSTSSSEILVFDCLSQLESLHVDNFYRYRFNFPSNLKKLTLSRNLQPWTEASAFADLPNLQVLKLCSKSFIGEEWEMKEGDFPNLRVLKLSDLDIRSWNAPSDSFVCLEKLVVNGCGCLEEVPSCLGECPALQMIEVKRCRKSVTRSVEQIQQEQNDMGNEVLKIVIEYERKEAESTEDEDDDDVEGKEAESTPSKSEDDDEEEGKEAESIPTKNEEDADEGRRRNRRVRRWRRTRINSPFPAAAESIPSQGLNSRFQNLSSIQQEGPINLFQTGSTQQEGRRRNRRRGSWRTREKWRTRRGINPQFPDKAKSVPLPPSFTSLLQKRSVERGGEEKEKEIEEDDEEGELIPTEAECTPEEEDEEEGEGELVPTGTGYLSEEEDEEEGESIPTESESISTENEEEDDGEGEEKKEEMTKKEQDEEEEEDGGTRINPHFPELIPSQGLNSQFQNLSIQQEGPGNLFQIGLAQQERKRINRRREKWRTRRGINPHFPAEVESIRLPPSFTRVFQKWSIEGRREEKEIEQESIPAGGESIPSQRD